MQVKISKTISVNPKHVILVILNTKTLKPVLVTIGGKVESDYTFEETDKLLNGEIVILKGR